MLLQIVLVLPLACTTLAIRDAVKFLRRNDTPTDKSEYKNKPIYYETHSNIIYLISPKTQKPVVIPEYDIQENLPPSTFMTPPLPGAKSEYFIPTESDKQDTWHPIIPEITNYNNILEKPHAKPVEENVPRKNEPSHFSVPIPTEKLEPPLQMAKFDYFVSPPETEFKLPMVKKKDVFFEAGSAKSVKRIMKPKANIKTPLYLKSSIPALTLHLTPPKEELKVDYKTPTKYPKKFKPQSGFQPIPIPLYSLENTSIEIPIARPMNPNLNVIWKEPKQHKYTRNDDRTHSHPELVKEHQLKTDDNKVSQLNETSILPEQEVSATSFRRQPLPRRSPAPPVAAAESQADPGPPAPDDRTEFRVHGIKGPHSYQFGYDTGKGKNRQFRYEERDNEGRVRGHYGYMDRDGKLRVVNYDADPEHGFHAE